MAVLVPSGVPELFSELADDIANERGEPLISPTELPAGEPIVVVAPPDELDSDVLHELREDASRTELESHQYSVITGQTAESARKLYFDPPDPGTGHWMFYGRSGREWRSHDDDVTVFNESIPTKEVERALEDRLASLSLYAASSSMHVPLGETLLCGIPSSTDGIAFDGTQPYCVDGSSATCPYDKQLVHADELKASHVFFPSCSSVLPNEEHDTPAYVGLTLLEGSASLIGSDWDTIFYEQELPLYEALLRAGYDVATICEVLNRSAEIIKGRRGPYIPFGRPSAGLPGGTGSYEVETKRQGTETVVTVSDINAPLIEMTLDGVIDSERYYVWYDGDGTLEAPLYYLVFEDGGELRLLIYGWGWLKGDRLRVRVSPTPRNHHERGRLRRCQQNVQSVIDLNVYGSKLKGQAKDLENKLRGLSELERQERYDLRAYERIVSRIDVANDAVRNITDRLLADAEPVSPHSPLGDYLDQISDERTVDRPTDCPYCDCPVNVQHLTDDWSTIDRAKGICPECGDIFDVPYGLREGSDRNHLTYPLLSVDDRPAEQRATVSLSFENPRDAERELLMGAKLFTNIVFPPSKRDGVDGAELFDVHSKHTVVGGRETETCAFELDTSELPENKYWLAGYVINELNVYAGYKPYLVGDTAGHRGYTAN